MRRCRAVLHGFKTGVGSYGPARVTRSTRFRGSRGRSLRSRPLRFHHRRHQRYRKSGFAVLTAARCRSRLLRFHLPGHPGPQFAPGPGGHAPRGVGAPRQPTTVQPLVTMSNPGNTQLDPLAPRDAKQLYEEDRRGEVSAETLQSHGYRIERFIEFCEEDGIENLNNVDGRDIHRYKVARSNEVNTVTLKSHLDTLRVFLRFCASIDAVRSDLPESVISPSVSVEENRAGTIVPPSTVQTILDYLDRYEYASTHHCLLRLLWETGMRMGAARGIDLADIDHDDEYIEITHDPEEDTPLKNGERGARIVAISPVLSGVIEDYVDVHRVDQTDAYGREPLLTTTQGRITKPTLRNYVYRATRPCQYGQECPHNRDPQECEAMEHMSASKCPSSEGPHAVRRSAITHYLSEDVPKTAVSDRMDVSREVLDNHYDERSERRKMEQRRDYLPY